eukprot:g2132.t1
MQAWETYTSSDQKITNVCLIGFGILGRCVGTELALSGVDIIVCDRGEDTIARLPQTVDQVCAPMVSDGLLSESDVTEAKARIRGTTVLADAVAEAHLVIEMVPEVEHIKVQVLQDVLRNAPPGVIIASSTITLNLDVIATQLASPGSLLGMRFLHPCVLVDHVEVTYASNTDETTWHRALGFLRSLHKHPFPGPNRQRLNSSEITMLQRLAAATRRARRDGAQGGQGDGIGEEKGEDSGHERVVITIHPPTWSYTPGAAEPVTLRRWRAAISMREDLADVQRGDSRSAFSSGRAADAKDSDDFDVEGQPRTVPDDFFCPITQEIMVDPVTAADGGTYERNAIMRWMSVRCSSPLTNLWLSSKDLRPNAELLERMLRFFGVDDRSPAQSMRSLGNRSSAAEAKE